MSAPSPAPQVYTTSSTARVRTRVRAVNPVFSKDLTITLRTPMYLASVGLALGTLALLAFGVLVSNGSDFRANADAMFELTLGGAALLMVLVGSSLGASTIAQEREARTIDALTLSALGPRRIVLGKFAAAYVATVLVTFATLPILVPVVGLGGLPWSALPLALAGQLALGALVVATSVALSAHARSMSRIMLLTLLLALVGTLTLGVVLASMAASFTRHGGFHLEGPYFFAEAYFLLPFSPGYAVGLLVAPAYVLTSVLSLSYIAARAGLQAPSEDRLLGVKRWAALTVAIGGGLVVGSAHALSLAEVDARTVATGWVLGVGLLALGLLFVFVGEPLVRRRALAPASRGGAWRLFPPGLVPSVVFVLVGVAIAVPAGVGALIGFDPGGLHRALWAVAYLGAIGGLMGFVAAAKASSPPTAARTAGALVLALSSVGLPIAVNALGRHAVGSTWLNAFSPTWVAWAARCGATDALVSGGSLVLALVALSFVGLMVLRARRHLRP